MAGATEATETRTLTVTMNGQEIKARPGQTILEVARDNGIDIPTLCYDPRLEAYGACRMCLVEVEGARGPMAACGTSVTDGMVVNTHTEKIVKLRKFLLELLLTNHPLDCPVCEAAGDCRLQDYAYEYQVDMVPWGWREPGPQGEGDHPNIAHNPNRCILCGRCLRMCRDVMAIGCWGYVNRGYDSQIDTPYHLPLEEVGCVSCGQCVSSCPVGALYGKRTQYAAREWQTDKTRTVCPYCGDGCQVVLYTYGGKLSRVGSQMLQGVNRGNLCVKGRYGMEFVNSPERLTSPLVRDDTGKLVPASWPEALERIEHKVTQIRAKSENDAFAVICSGWVTNETAYLAQKFARSVLGSNSVDNPGRLKHGPTEVALGMAFGLGAMTCSADDIAKADVIVVIGSNMTESHPVLALEVIKGLRDEKALIVIDPRTTDLARRAAIHLAPKSGTDDALLLGMMRHVVALGLEDKAFIDARTEGYEALKDTLKKITVDQAAATCRVPADDIRKAGSLIAEAASVVFLYGSGLTGFRGGTANVLALADLALLTGNVGRAGTGVGPLRAQANAQGLMDMGVTPEFLPGYQSLDDQQAVERVQAAWGVDLKDLSSGLTYMEILSGVESGDIRFLYVIGDNVAVGAPDEQRVRATLKKSEFLVVQDFFLSETAEYADVVLPAGVPAEDDGTYTNTDRHIQRVRPAMGPRGQSKPDWQIVQAMANALGADWAYASSADVMNEIAEVAPIYAGVSHRRLDAGALQWPVPDVDHPGTARLYETEFARGKGKFHALEHEAPFEDVDEEFYLILTHGSELAHQDSSLCSRRAPGLMALVKEPQLEIHPDDAERLGVSNGARVEVTSRRGTVQVSARLTDRVPKGLVFMPGFSPAAPVQRLTGSWLDQRSKTPETKVSAVRVHPLD